MPPLVDTKRTLLAVVTVVPRPGTSVGFTLLTVTVLVLWTVTPVGPVGPIAPVPVDKTTSSSWLLQVSPDGTARRPPLELMQTLSVVSVCATKGRHPYATPDSARKERMRTQTAMMRERSNMLERLGVSRLLAVSTFAHPPG